MRKYHNQKVEDNGEVFDSKKEYGRWVDLKWMQKAGQISNLQRQVKFELIPSQRIDGKVVERACNYIADFVYLRDGQVIVEDVKPTFRSEKARKTFQSTTAYRIYAIKRKLMLQIYGVQITEV